MKQNILVKEVYIIALNAKNDKRIQSFSSIEIYVYGTSKDLKLKNEEIK